MQLTLALSPRRPRNNVVFDHAHVTRMGGTNHHAIFDHVAGGTMCTRLFKHYTMPDGSTKHLYHPTKKLVDEVDVPPESSPSPPSSMEEALQVYTARRPGSLFIIIPSVLVVSRCESFRGGFERDRLDDRIVMLPVCGGGGVGDPDVLALQCCPQPRNLSRVPTTHDWKSRVARANRESRLTCPGTWRVSPAGLDGRVCGRSGGR